MEHGAIFAHKQMRPIGFLPISWPRKPHSCTAQTAEMIRPHLDERANMKHKLIHLAGPMDCELIEPNFEGYFRSGRGRYRRVKSTRGWSAVLQRANGACYEIAVYTWLGNPYWQLFTGGSNLQAKLSINPSRLTLTRRRRRRGAVVGHVDGGHPDRRVEQAQQPGEGDDRGVGAAGSRVL